MKRSLGCLGVVLVFVFGVCVGGFLGSVDANKKLFRWLAAGASDGPERALEMAAKRLRRELKLTDQQQKSFDVIVSDTQGRLREVQRKAQPEVNAALHDAEGRVRVILTPEQTKKFDEIIHRGRPKQATPSPAPRSTPTGT